MENDVKSGILFVPFMTGKGGTERVIQNLFDELNKRENSKIKLTIESIGGSDNYDWSKNTPINVTKISSDRNIRNLYYLLCLPFVIFFKILKVSPDFVISTNPVMWFLAKVSSKLLRRKTRVISWYHYSLLQKPINSKILNSADYYLAISSGIQKQLIQNGVAVNSIKLVYNPVRTSDKIIARPSINTKFIYIGRLDLDGQKNIREFLTALSMVNGEWSLETYGDDSNKNEINAVASELDVKQRIHWNGFKENVWDEIDEATAIVLTSKYEGLPMVLCEAITHGIYSISSNVETGPIDIINSKNGELYVPGDVEGLTKILQKIVNHKELPDQNIIVQSAQKFNSNEYANNFEKAILKSMK